jgi:hypothetical protein
MSSALEYLQLHLQYLKTISFYIHIIEDQETIFQIFYNLVETQLFTRIKELKTHNRSEYVNKELSAFEKQKALLTIYYYYMYIKTVYLSI